MKKILIIILFLILHNPVFAVTYFVSPNGDDYDDGLTEFSGWASIEHGDTSGVLVPGDTINILPGTYNISNMITLSTSGDISGSITYRKFGLADVYIDGGNIVDTIIQITGSHTKLLDIILLNSGGDVISLDADSCEISGCKVYDYIYQGVDITGSNNLIYKNIFSRTNQSGVVIRAGAENNFVYGNTISDCLFDGIWISPSVTTTRVFNNIIVSAGDGIDGTLGNICGYNNIWNSIYNDYANGVIDSAGGISVDPMFQNPGSDDYSLKDVSFCIDRGLDLGYSYDGIAPDMGAIEFTPNNGTSYYVSPTGDNNNDGLSPSTPWLNIENGEWSKVIASGDTVNIMPGIYSLTTTVTLLTSGTSSAPIVYRSYQANVKNRVVVDLNNTNKPAFQLEGNHTELLDVSVTNADDNGIVVLADSCKIAYCKVFNVTKRGIRIYGSYNLIYKNICYDVGFAGIKNEDNGEYNLFYNNTVHSNDGNGINIDVGVFTSRIINNIITENGNKGISCNVENICAYNNVWGNLGGDYIDGAVDSAGGISVSPRFINPLLARFDLQETSLEINTGLDLGYAFNGSAPDMGAVEKYNNYYVSTTGDNTKDGKSELNAWATIDNGDSLLYPGDTVHVLPGTYISKVIISDTGADENDLITYKGVRDSTMIDATGFDSSVFISGNFVEWTGISVQNSTGNNFIIDGNNVTVSYCQILSAGADGIHSNGKIIAHNNSIANNIDDGIHVTLTDSCKIFNNTIYSNVNGINCENNDNEIYNNIISENSAKGILSNSTNTISYCIFYNNTTLIAGGGAIGFGSLFIDPLMVDPVSNNFRIQSNSPAIDAGFDDGSSFNGLAPDMGAYEANLLTSLTIVPVYDSLFADLIYDFDVAAFDMDGNPADYGLLTWEHTFATGVIDADGIFNPEKIDSGEIIVTSSIGAFTDTSNMMNVVVGTLTNLIVNPNSAIISSDSIIQFSLIGTDSDGNSTTEYGNVTWGMSKSIGNIDSTGLFIPTKLGITLVTALSDLGPLTITDTIEVISGGISYIDVIPATNTVIEDSTFQYSVYGYDADSNLVKDLTDSVTWTIDDPLGNITIAGLYTAGANPSPPNYFVNASYQSWADSGEVTVLSNGSLSFIRIEYLDGTPVTDFATNTDNDTTVIYCRGYAADSTLLGDLSVQWVLLGNDTIGYFSDTIGTFETIILNKPGTGQIEAVFSSTIKDTSGVITCQTGTPIEFIITPDTLEITTDSSTIFSAVAIDADSNITDSVIVPAFNVLGGIGTINLLGQFIPTTTGVGYIEVSGAGLFDTTKAITVLPGALSYVAVAPDSIIISADSLQQFQAIGYDSKNNIADAGTISWSVINGIGTIDASGLYDASNVGVTQIVAQSSLGKIDTSSYLEIISGNLVNLVVSPDSVLISTDSTITFFVTGFDSDGNTTNTGDINWGVIGSIGFISPTGIFTPTLTGSGRVYAQSSGGISDTNTSIVVTAGLLNQIVILSDTSIVNLYDSLQFTAIGYDADFNITDVGTLTWGVVNGLGTIDASGLFISNTHGYEKITVNSSINDKGDTTEQLAIEALLVGASAHELSIISPNDKDRNFISFKIENQFVRNKTLDSVKIRDLSTGQGNLTERLSNIDSLSLYLDTDFDNLLTSNDLLLDKKIYNADSIIFSFSPQTIIPGNSITLLVGADINLFARDNDSLMVYLLSDRDFYTQDNTPFVGADTIYTNSPHIVDGMIADQIELIPVLIDSITSMDTIINVLTCDIPRNGYSEDSLRVFNIINVGTASEIDIDSLVLYKDNGNLIWEDIQNEIKIGKLSFTGDRWTRSGLFIPLTTQTTRFYVVAYMNKYPNNNATLSLTIPQYGLEVSSLNDGPIDKSLVAVDTIVIVTNERLDVVALDLPTREIIQGQSSGPLLNVSFNNTYSSPIILDSIRFDYQGIDLDGATQNQLDSQINNVKLYLQLDGNYDDISPDDSLLSQSIVTNGEVLFETNGLTIGGNGGSFVLSVEADLELSQSKNGNSLAFVLSDSLSIYSGQNFLINGLFPISNGSSFMINSFPASAVTLNPVLGETIYGGQTKQLVLDIIIPANGYDVDTLISLKIQNVGSQDDNEAVQAIKLWIDIDGNGFSATDKLLGTFSNLGTYWEISGLLQTIPVGGERLFVTIDIFDKNFTGGTLQYEIMTQGCLYRSGMMGPDDTVIQNSYEDIVFPSDRITVISIPGTEEIIHPGASDKTILTFALYNGYADRAQTLQSVGLTNISHSLSSLDYCDFELGFVSIYFDADKSTTLNEKTPIANGRFINGKLQLSGLNVTLPSEELSYFFVVSALPLSLIDSDSLAISIESPSDFIFTENVNINGVLPLRRENYLIIDGSTASQYSLHKVTPTTLCPGDTLVPFLSFSPAMNGDLGDILDSVIIENVETADNTDISSLDLWLDINNDSIFQQTDSLLGTFNYSTNMWKIGGLSLPIDTIAPVLIVTGDVSLSAIPDKAFRPRIPVNGCFYLSGNDGPNDLPIIGENTFTISASNLRIKTSQLKQAYSVGEAIEVRFTATNLSASTLNNIYGRISNISDSLAVSLDSSYGGPVSLGVGQSKDFVYYYTANSVSELNWEMIVVATDINDSSSIVATPLVQIQSSPSNVPVVLINSMPTAVTKGQSNVFPLSLTISHPDTSSNSAPIRLDSLFLTIESGSGLPQLASDLFSRIVFTADYTNLTIIENVPALSTVPLYFEQPVIINANEQQNFSLLVDINSTSTANDLVLAISSYTDIPIEDNNNNVPVSIAPSVVFPLKTASSRIESPSQNMELAYNPLINSSANYGQKDFDLVGFTINHPGSSNSSQIQLTSLSFEVLDEFDNSIIISDLFDRVKIRRQQLVVADRSDLLDTTLIQLQLESPITLSPGESDSIVVMANINSSSTVSAFKIRISDSTSFIVRDLSSGANITVTADTASLATSNLFPVVTSTTNLKIAAESPQFCYNTTLPPTVITGRDSLELASFSLQYPYSALYSPVVLKSVLVYVLDSLEKPLDPTQLFDRIGYQLNSASTIQYQPYILLSSGAVLFEFNTDGILLNPGDSVDLTLFGDIEADVTYDHFRLMVNESSSFSFVDQTDSTSLPALMFTDNCNQSFPIQTIVSSIISPAGRPLIETSAPHVKNVFVGQQNVPIFSTTLNYNRETMQGDLLFTYLKGSITKRLSNTYLSYLGKDLFTNMRLLFNGIEVIADSTFSYDSLFLSVDTGISISNGDVVDITILADLKTDVSSGNYRIKFIDSTFLGIEDLQLATNIYPVLLSGEYPILSTELSLTEANLKESFSNYPNPFGVESDKTTITFVLSENGLVNIELFTLTGESVLHLVKNDNRIAGVYDTDTWAGNNNNGQAVVPGTYFCRINVKYASGKEETELRKISVIR